MQHQVVEPVTPKLGSGSAYTWIWSKTASSQKLIWNLAYCGVAGFVDDFMAFCLEGEARAPAGFFPWPHALSRRRGLVQEIGQWRCRLPRKDHACFCMDLKRGIGYLDIKWKLHYIK
jgi:hypothetical protein